MYLPFHFIMKVFSFFPDKGAIGSPIPNHSHVIYITILKRLQEKYYSLARGIWVATFSCYNLPQISQISTEHSNKYRRGTWLD